MSAVMRRADSLPAPVKPGRATCGSGVTDPASAEEALADAGAPYTDAK
jgi:hypothetical protein